MGHEHPLPQKGSWKLASLYPTLLRRGQESNLKPSSSSDAWLRWEMRGERRALPPSEMGGSVGEWSRSFLLFPACPVAEEVKGRGGGVEAVDGGGCQCSQDIGYIEQTSKWTDQTHKYIEDSETQISQCWRRE